MALKAFLLEKVDAAIVEVGIGGRFDQTNFIRRPAVSVVTGVSLEHTDVLGDTLEKIALNKAGIFKLFSSFELPTHLSLFSIDHTPLNPTDWNLVSIWFQGHIYPSIEALIGAYENGSVHIIQRPFVDLYHTQLQPGPSQQQNVRFGNDVPTSEAISPRSLGDTLRSTFGPKQSSPSSSNLNRNGFKGVQMTKKHDRNRRISLRQRRVQFEHWDFHFTLRRETGLRVYNVRFAGRKLIAEAGLDETVTAYWGVSPFMRSMTSLESMYGVGAMTSSLSPGIDCPLEAIYLPALMIPNAQQGPRVIKQAICLFEWTMQPPGGPERRHFEFFGENIQAVDGSTPTASHTNFGLGVPSKALVLRSIASLFNYDYIFDIVFHNSGVVELAVTPTGYVHLDTVFSQRSENNTGGVQRPHSWDTNHAYGFPSSKFPIYFVIHQHLFLYQIDLDVMGEKNFVRVVDTHGQINHNRGRSVCQLPGHSDESSCPALWMTFRDVKTETEARYSMNFEHPKQYLVCQSGSEGSGRVNPRCVSLVNRGAIKTLLGDNHTRAFSWSKYQLVVTKRKASEPYASSMFNGVDIVSPVVDFNSFSEDDENILHEDIVLWVTLGNIHLPRQEDLPNTGTSAGRLSLYIQPHNMFEYSPDAFSCDRVYTNSMAEWLKGFVESTDCVTEPIPML
ncbi:unnamed protein product [Dicrocoelium dendriticum]|nr:unnamed protein product [Dicrocoelium dendriticum]